MSNHSSIVESKPKKTETERYDEREAIFKELDAEIARKLESALKQGQVKSLNDLGMTDQAGQEDPSLKQWNTAMMADLRNTGDRGDGK
jgi:hypothetical protein